MESDLFVVLIKCIQKITLIIKLKFNFAAFNQDVSRC